MNRVAIVTGASRGIGRGISLELAKKGFDLAINYCTRQDAAEFTSQLCQRQAEENGVAVQTFEVQADVGLAPDRDRLIAQTKDRFGRLDLLVNNAGITSLERSDLLLSTEESFDRVMNVNLKGPFFLTQAAAAWMINDGILHKDRRPKIISIGSISSYTVSVNRGDYCMAKAALRMMTRLYAVRLAEWGIPVYEICPGVIQSDMTAPVKKKYDRLIAEGITPIKRWGLPEDVGAAVARLADDRIEFCTGEVFNVDGGFHIRQL